MNEVARYTYDSWGKVISVTDSAGNAITDTNNIAHKNPYRYRGYRYDAETGLYYLQSRYYNPEWSRFVNADGLVSTGQGMLSHNMYVYCENNPVNLQDFTGEIPGLISAITIGILSVIAIFTIPKDVWQEMGETVGTAINAGIETGDRILSTINNKTKRSSKTTNVTSQKSNTNTTTISQTATATKTNIRNRPTKQQVFPINPYEFNPKGCIRTIYSGTKNGSVITWTQGNVTIFRYDQDYKNTGHYHVMPTRRGENFHYWPLMPVPFPFNKIYF